MNNITTIDSHVVLPHQADWSRIPEVTRRWRSRIVSALSAEEDRVTVRHSHWRTLRYQVKPYDHVERSRFQDRLREALKAAKIAVPHFGQGVSLGDAVLASHGKATLARTSDNFVVDDWVLIQSTIPSEYDIWDLMKISSISGRVLTFTDSIGSDHSTASSRVWPLLYGRPVPPSFSLRNYTQSTFTVEVQGSNRVITT